MRITLQFARKPTPKATASGVFALGHHDRAKPRRSVLPHLRHLSACRRRSRREYQMTHIISIAITALGVGALLALIVWAATLTPLMAGLLIGAMATAAAYVAYRRARGTL